ncbi:MAG: MBL fold metallo-hydrolase [Candidatus Sericytochromatia bacterium]
MKIKFWGVRGSIPTPWSEAMQVGGNTSCVQVLTDSDELLVLDAGTGIRMLGKALIEAGEHRSRRVHLLLSHTHWDHIQGLPFFGLANYPDNHLVVYGANKAERTLEEVVRAQMDSAYFPVSLAEVGAQIDFQPVPEGDFQIGRVQIRAAVFNHPGGVYGYRLCVDGQVLVYATDMEYTPQSLDQRLIDFAQGADLLIYDAQYTSAELETKTGWGHSSPQAAAALAQAAGVKKLYLFSHDPDHSDADLVRMAAEAQTHFPQTYLACEGQTVSLRDD